MATELQDLAAGPSTRKRVRAATPLPAAAPGLTTESATLQAAMRELQQLRGERLHERDEFEARLRQRDEMLRTMEERLRLLSNTQLSPPDNRARNADSNSPELGFKLKPDNYDGGVPLREFLTQFELIARANGWNNSHKTVALAACLRDKARSVLDGIFEIESLNFEDLKSKLELRFGEGHLAQTYHSQFTNRKQRVSEDLATLGSDLERLSRLAYPECSHEVRDKIACAQFIAALSDGFLRRTLQLENVTSLKIAVERAMAVKVIQESSFSKSKFNQKDENKSQECWKCGDSGHFRAECPSKKEE